VQNKSERSKKLCRRQWPTALKLLATVSKGGAVDLSAEDLTEATEKSLNQRLKSANDAVRTAQAHVKSNKENAPASAKSRAKAKKQ